MIILTTAADIMVSGYQLSSKEISQTYGGEHNNIHYKTG